jgi:hypothetical protein
MIVQLVSVESYLAFKLLSANSKSRVFKFLLLIIDHWHSQAILVFILFLCTILILLFSLLHSSCHLLAHKPFV